MAAEAYFEFWTFEYVVYQTEHKISEIGSVSAPMWNDLEGPNQFYLKQTARLDE